MAFGGESFANGKNKKKWWKKVLPTVAATALLTWGILCGAHEIAINFNNTEIVTQNPEDGAIKTGGFSEEESFDKQFYLDKIAELEKNNALSEDEKEDLEILLYKLKSECENKDDIIKALEDYKSNHPESGGAIKKLFGVNLQLEDEKTQLEGEKTQLEGENKQLENANKQLEDEKMQLEGENKQLEDEKTQLEGENKQLEDEKTQLEGENKQLEDEKTQLEGENKQLEGENKQLENANKQLEDDSKKWQNKYEEATQKLEDYINANPNASDAELNKFVFDLLGKFGFQARGGETAGDALQRFLNENKKEDERPVENPVDVEKLKAEYEKMLQDCLAQIADLEKKVAEGVATREELAEAYKTLDRVTAENEELKEQLGGNKQSEVGDEGNQNNPNDKNDDAKQVGYEDGSVLPPPENEGPDPGDPKDAPVKDPVNGSYNP